MRKFCNPNVAIELGYAVRELGWDRIVLVFNEAYGKLPDDLPFDAKGHRTLKYRCFAELDGKKLSASPLEQIKNAKGHLRGELAEALKAIIASNPKRPRELEARSPEELRRERDLVQIRRVFYWIHLGVMDQFLERLGRGRITVIGEEFHAPLDALVKSLTLHLSDLTLASLITDLTRAWGEALKYSASMELSHNGQESFFKLNCDVFVTAEQEQEHRHTIAQAAPLREALDRLLVHVRGHYLEIDPATTGREAVKQHTEQDPF
jgi:hypothetical protein